jgi:hypothetical protein
MPEAVSIHEANQHLSRYLEPMEGGAEFVITRRAQSSADRSNSTSGSIAGRIRPGGLSEKLVA